MHWDMDCELREMVHTYKYLGCKLKEILECMAIAHAEGIDISEFCCALLDKIAGANPRAV